MTSSVYHMTSIPVPWHTSYEVLSSSIVESQSLNEYYTYLDSLIIPSSSNELECMRASACKYYFGILVKSV